MRTLQYWILVFGSFFVSVLLIREIFLIRDLRQAHAQLVECQEKISQAGGYERSWKAIISDFYRVAPNDQALAELLKKNRLGLRPHPSANAGSAPASTPSAAPDSSKPPVAPVPPTTP
ncbi:MAG TPA: hypothetical protein VGZ93_13095 [Candidatus Methylacidiphilales bacterium]|jgi:hypothetical protein|nr:hypothetical protein [Candidatus Methylacidiphilales bacterium]